VICSGAVFLQVMMSEVQEVTCGLITLQELMDEHSVR
jgi:hypothetical protein